MESRGSPTHPPCSPVKGVREFFEKVTAKALPARINKNYLASVGAAAGNEQHLVSTLRFLGLIDKAGVPTRHFDVLYLKGPERKRGLQNLLRQAYPSLFTGELNLETATRSEVHDHFVRRFALRGQMPRKATAVFALLCHLAGITVSPDLVPAGRSPASQRAAKTAPRGPADAPPAGEQADRRQPATAAAPLQLAGPNQLPIMVMLTPDLTEDEIVAFLRRIKRATQRADSPE